MSERQADHGTGYNICISCLGGDYPEENPGLGKVNLMHVVFSRCECSESCFHDQCLEDYLRSARGVQCPICRRGNTFESVQIHMEGITNAATFMGQVNVFLGVLTVLLHLFEFRQRFQTVVVVFLSLLSYSLTISGIVQNYIRNPDRRRPLTWIIPMGLMLSPIIFLLWASTSMMDDIVDVLLRNRTLVV